MSGLETWESIKKSHKLFDSQFDWTRNRFQGNLQKIVVSEGIITEKIYLTPKGNRISIKRRELGFYFWINSLLTQFTSKIP